MNFWHQIPPGMQVSLVIAGWLLLWLVPTLGLLWLVYFLISLPMRRQQNAQLMLEVVQAGLAEGRTLEQTMVALSATRDRSLGLGFHLLAAWIEAGLRFEQALGQVPHLLSPQLCAILRVGRELGDLRRVLPVCRQLLADSRSQVRGALNYLLVIAFAVTPTLPAVFVMLLIWVVPKLKEISMDMGTGFPPISAAVFNLSTTLIWIQVVLVVCVELLAVSYVGGPRLRSWGNRVLFNAMDALALALPWRRRRLYRDFSAMLAILLDAGFPEERALQLAAESTGNTRFLARVQPRIAALRNGASLMSAVATLDPSGEFRWRLENAARGRTGFWAALRGWLEALDAKAFQQEQIAAHVLTTSLVLVNGLLVGLLAVALFSILTSIINAGL